MITVKSTGEIALEDDIEMSAEHLSMRRNIYGAAFTRDP